jgi:hypothetical protein
MKRAFRFLGIAVLCAACAACAACGSATVATKTNDWAVMDKSKTYGVRKTFNVCSVPAETFLTKQAVQITRIKHDGGLCKQVAIFCDGEVIKVLGENGGKYQLLFEKLGKSFDLESKKVLEDGREKVLLMHTVFKEAVENPGNDPENYDFYVMLRDDNIASQLTTPKRYRVEAFPASGWQDGHSCKQESCDCERPDIETNLGDPIDGSLNFPNETESGEGHEPRH